MEKEQNNNNWSGKSRGGTFGYAFFVLLIRRLGIRFAYAFLILVVPYFVLFAPKSSRSIIKYYKRVHNLSTISAFFRLFSHYYTFGQTIIDKVAIINGLSNKYHYEFDNYKEFLSVLDSGAVVMIGAHVGCWDIGATYFGNYASRLNVVLLDAEHQQIKKNVDTSRFGYKIIALNDNNIESLLKMKKAIDNKEYLCFQGDRFLAGANNEAVNFFNNKAAFPLGPTLLASKFKTPTVFYFAMREKGMKYRFIFKTLKAGHSQKDIMQQYINELENIVKNYPQQWFNFFDLWQ